MCCTLSWAQDTLGYLFFIGIISPFFFSQLPAVACNNSNDNNEAAENVAVILI